MERLGKILSGGSAGEAGDGKGGSSVFLSLKN